MAAAGTMVDSRTLTTAGSKGEQSLGVSGVRGSTFHMMMKRKLNTTVDGELACCFGTPWQDHFDPPIGSGKGCEDCMRRWGNEPREVEKPKKLKASERMERLHLSTSNTVAMLERRAEAIKQTLGEENPLRLDLLATKDLLIQWANEP